MGLLTADFGRSNLIVVVDERTYRGAASAVQRAVDEGDYLRAYEGLTAMIFHCRQAARTAFRKRKRVLWAWRLEQAELQRAGVRPVLGLG